MRNMRVSISVAVLFLSTVVFFQNCSSGFQSLQESIAPSSSDSSSSSPSPLKIGTPQVVHTWKNSKGLCNAVSFSQIPNNLDYFVGRVMNESSAGACDSTSWSLALFKMDWETNTLNLVKYIFQPDAFESTGKKIASSYDPHVVFFNNELWVAFECAGEFGIMASSCVAPFTIENGVDTKRMNVIVVGSYTNSNTETHSASVPKLFVYKGELYIYWTVCRFLVKNNAFLLVEVTSRGAKVTQETSGLKRLWVQNSIGTPLPASDRSVSSEVWGGTENDPTANSTADIFDIFVTGDTIYAVAAVGPVGCVTPLSPLVGCYRTRIASSTTPLGHHIFNKNFVNEPVLPSNPMEYVRFFKTPSGNHFMMGQHTSVTLNGTARPASMIDPGYQKYSIDLLNLKTVPTGTSEGLEPNPTIGAGILAATFSNMQIFHDGCESSGATNIACNAAVSRYCQSQGFLSGTPVLQHTGDKLTTICVARNAGTQFVVALNELKFLNSGCTQISTASGGCQSAVFHYCQNNGFPGGGFGPQEAGGETLTITCLKQTNSRQIATTFTALSAITAACRSTSAASDSCRAAADLMCRQQGAVGGYGIVNYVGNDAVIGCIQ